MSLTTEERERFGVVVHLSGAEYQNVMALWCFDIPSNYGSSLEALRQYRYFTFVVGGRIKAIGEIERWSFEAGDDCKLSASFSEFSKRIEGLASRFRDPISAIHWLNGHQSELIKELLLEGVEQRPIDALPSLDIEEAARSVARWYSVTDEQVEITIRSKSALRQF